MSEYALDQAVRPVATPEPGRFAVELDDAWRALGGVVNGGYSTAVDHEHSLRWWVRPIR